MERESQGLSVFISYAHKDEYRREQLGSHIKILERAGLIAAWHDRKIDPSDEWAEEIDENLERANIILLLMSADFINSDDCYQIEGERAPGTSQQR